MRRRALPLLRARTSSRPAAGCLAFLALAGCANGSDDIAPGFADQIRAAQEESSVVLPEQLPPDLLDAWVSQSGDTSSVSFYSTNAPVVQVCSGDAEKCRALNPHAAEVRSDRIDGRETVLLLGRRDDPDAPDPQLPDELAQFWSSVDLVSTDPSWLAGD